jgi:hypothetical protein
MENVDPVRRHALHREAEKPLSGCLMTILGGLATVRLRKGPRDPIQHQHNSCRACSSERLTRTSYHSLYTCSVL